MTIGNYNYDGTYDDGFIGWIKGVRIYNKILSAAEVTTLYGGTLVTDGLLFATLYRHIDGSDTWFDAADVNLVDGVYGDVAQIIDSGFNIIFVVI